MSNERNWIEFLPDENLREIEAAAEEFGFELTLSDGRGPVELTHPDGSEVSLVKSAMTGTFAVEYEVGEDVSAGVAVTKHSFNGEYHHQSWAAISDAVEWVVNVLKQHVKENSY